MGTILTIAGSDPTSGAGIQADIRVSQSLGHYPINIITCLTQQNTLLVDKIYEIPIDYIEKQMLILLEDFSPDIVKIGMITNLDILKKCLSILLKNNVNKIIWDPILSSSTNRKFLSTEDLKSNLDVFEKISCITPNEVEFNKIFSLKITDKNIFDLLEKIKLKNLIITGRNNEKEVLTNEWYSLKNRAKYTAKSPTISTNNTHGTGCLFSTSLACFMLSESNPQDILNKATRFVNEKLKSNINTNLGLGKGCISM